MASGCELQKHNPSPIYAFLKTENVPLLKVLGVDIY